MDFDHFPQLLRPIPIDWNNTNASLPFQKNKNTSDNNMAKWPQEQDRAYITGIDFFQSIPLLN